MGLVVPSSQVVCMGAVEWQGYTVVTPHHLGVCECEMGLVVPSSQVVCMGAVEWQGYTVVTPHHLGVCECETVFFLSSTWVYVSVSLHGCSVSVRWV
jgi:hypothetical protein